ncbi:MAG TPA: DUF4129 domain-containing protein [Pyrinomonadaceae bacterium]|nr:DUF4129 domain-containing protein [Pyrinomonadaceae bacterium]
MPQHHNRTAHHLRWSLFALLLLVPITANADTIPAAGYHNNVQRAVTALDSLRQIDENETSDSYEHRLDQTIAGVDEVLPEHQSVQTSEGVCDVDNSWLHEELKQLKSASTSEQRETRLAQVIERLKAVEERVGPGTTATTPQGDKTQTKEKLESILARPEYASEAKGSSALGRLIMDFIRWLQQFLPKGMQVHPGGSPWMSVVAQILVVLVALVVLFYVAKILLARFKPKRRQRAPKKREPRIVLGERLEPEETSGDLLSEAEALARRGEIRSAIRKAYIALLVELGDRKVIALAQHKTNRDYLNSVRNLPLHQNMRGLTDSFERHWYGLVEASDNDWQTFRSAYYSALQTQN